MDDELTVDEVIKICKKTKDERIEVMDDPITRSKNFEFMTKYEYTYDDVKNVIHSLTKSDYVAGPELDYNPKRDHPVWKFIKYLNDIRIEVYIKIKIIHKNTKIQVISIHEEGLYD